MNGNASHHPFCLPKIERARISGGLEVFIVPWPELPLLSAHLVLPRGAEADPSGKGGLADIAAEMLTLGTKRRSASELAERVDRMGAALSAHAGWDYSSVNVFGLREDFESLLELLREVYTEPAFSPDEFEQLQKRHIAMLIQQKDDSSILADERFNEMLFQGTPYDHPVYGNLKTIPLLAVEEAQAFYRQSFLPEGSFLVVAGDVGSEEVLRWIESHFPPVEKKSQGAQVRFSPPAPREIKTFLVNRPDLTQSQIRLGHMGMAHSHPDFLPFDVMNYVLGGGGFSSRLMQRVRVELGYTYGIRSSLEPRKNPGPFTIATFTPTETTFGCVQEILAVLRSFLDQGAAEAERTEAVRFLTGSYPMRFETPGQMAQRIIQAQIHGLGLEFLSSYPRQVGEVALREMGRCAREHIHPDGMSLVIVGRTEAFRRDLESLGPVETGE